jgi:hypothetical protein
MDSTFSYDLSLTEAPTDAQERLRAEYWATTVTAA